MKIWGLLPTGLASIVRSVGWSPLGRRIALTIGETAGAPPIGTRYEGTIVGLNGHASAVVQLSDQSTVTLRARNVGYDFYYLAIGPIATYVSRADPENPFAAGILRLSRS